MSDIAIKIENLGKRYRYGGPAAASYNLRQDLTDWARGMFRRKSGQKSAVSGQPSGLPSDLRPLTSPHSQSSATSHQSLKQIHEEHLAHDPNCFWALKDINLEVRQGEVVGIIGRNGAGKSTLLKILSRITPPTTGKITYNGRMASLLEVGTGFHRELTGRENIFLNGSILGMKRNEIAKKFDEIVAFAEVDKFIDTPVKFYSSGMYVRLAFAVAAHLEPEILVVDEVLAVGDAQFQKKCLGKMGDVAKQGRTVIFVSHNMAALAAICQTAVVLDSGMNTFHGAIRNGVDHYLGKSRSRQSHITYQPSANCDVQLKSIAVVDANSHGKEVFSMAEPIRIQIEYYLPRPIERIQIVCHLWNIHRVHVFASADIDGQPSLLDKREAGRYVSEIAVPPSLIGPGVYQVTVACGVPNLRLIDDREGPTFEVNAIYSDAAKWSGARKDVVLALPMSWTVVRTDS